MTPHGHTGAPSVQAAKKKKKKKKTELRSVCGYYSIAPREWNDDEKWSFFLVVSFHKHLAEGRDEEAERTEM